MDKGLRGKVGDHESDESKAQEQPTAGDTPQRWVPNPANRIDLSTAEGEGRFMARLFLKHLARETSEEEARERLARFRRDGALDERELFLLLAHLDYYGEIYDPPLASPELLVELRAYQALLARPD